MNNCGLPLLNLWLIQFLVNDNSKLYHYVQNIPSNAYNLAIQISSIYPFQRSDKIIFLLQNFV